MIADIVKIGILYIGLGYLLSRFLDSMVRNNPFTWLFLTIVFLPICLNFITLFIDIGHYTVFVLSIIFVVVRFAIHNITFKNKHVYASLSDEKNSVGKIEFITYTALVGFFFIALLIPKSSLILATSASIGDDFNKTNEVLATAYNLQHPISHFYPVNNLSHHYGFWLMPGIVFRITSFSTQQAWYIHTILFYIAALSFILYVTIFFFKSIPARTIFLFGITFLSGFDYFVYTILGRSTPGHLEWWISTLPSVSNFQHQISSFYTLFVWVPHHLIATIAYICVMFLSIRREITLNRILIPILFAGILSFSTFVFMATVLAYGVTELWLFIQSNNKKKHAVWLGIQAVIFAIVGGKIALQYSTLFQKPTATILNPVHMKENIFTLFPFRIDFLNVSDFLPELEHATVRGFELIFNHIATWGFVLFIDMGIIFILALCYACSKQYKNIKPLSLHTYIVANCISIILLLSFVRTRGYNDLFMRAMIIVQFSLVLAASFFVQEHLRHFSLKIVLPICVFLLFPQTTNFLVEFHARSNYSHGSYSEIEQHIQNHLPKTALVVSDKCGKYFMYKTNRLCMKRDSYNQQYDQVDMESVYLLSSNQEESAKHIVSIGNHHMYLLEKERMHTSAPEQDK